LKPSFRFLVAICAAAWLGCSRPAGDSPKDRPADSPAAADVGPDSEGPAGSATRTPGPESPTAEPGGSATPEEPGERPAPANPPAGSSGSSGEAPGDEVEPITTEAGLRNALRAKNPGFAGELVVQFDPRSGLVQIAAQDPALKDISPLGHAQPLIRNLAGSDAAEPGAPEGGPPVAVALAKTDVHNIGPLAEIEGLVVLDLAKTDVRDLAPLSGKPIRELYLEETEVEDIGPLEGVPLEKLYLSHTKVKDLGPLKGAPLAELNIVGTQVSDLSPLEGSWVKMLWFSECPVTDISPLSKVPLVSVTMENTPVSDLSPLERHPSLRRLHIGRTQVTDLTPIKWLKLTRLIFTPARIEKGIGFARDMETLREIGPSFEQRMPPPQFWRMYEAGAFRKK